jgi:hypothetical protein
MVKIAKGGYNFYGLDNASEWPKLGLSPDVQKTILDLHEMERETARAKILMLEQWCSNAPTCLHMLLAHKKPMAYPFLMLQL